ncbi:MAG TPA: HAD-IA family hydrolase [Sphaerochaeta sp.]|nr:HAD-IA family hydrolase [Sphaerochaeta sp.]HQB90527.1 HAD-IA family hydrolase [Sphaerochaeta sp.]
MEKPAVIFDLDGTLVDTIADIRLAVEASVTDLSLGSLSNELVKTYVGRGLANTLRGVLSSFSITVTEDELRERTGRLVEYYRRHAVVESRPYDGIIELLERLQEAGMPLGVLSNKEDGLAKSIVATLLPTIEFVLVRGQRSGREIKPHPSTIGEFCDLLGRSPDTMLYVGDSEVDWQTAKAASVPVILVGWGFRPREALRALEGALFVDTIDELEEAINGI